jgi:hypothetical protein
MGVVIIYSVIIVTYRIGFRIDPVAMYCFEWWFDLLIDGLFFLDIMLSFNVAFMSATNSLVHDRGTVAKNYLRGWCVRVRYAARRGDRPTDRSLDRAISLSVRRAPRCARSPSRATAVRHRCDGAARRAQCDVPPPPFVTRTRPSRRDTACPDDFDSHARCSRREDRRRRRRRVSPHSSSSRLAAPISSIYTSASPLRIMPAGS